jgi:hypothetical protein
MKKVIALATLVAVLAAACGTAKAEVPSAPATTPAPVVTPSPIPTPVPTPTPDPGATLNDIDSIVEATRTKAAATLDAATDMTTREAIRAFKAESRNVRESIATLNDMTPAACAASTHAAGLVFLKSVDAVLIAAAEFFGTDGSDISGLEAAGDKMVAASGLYSETYIASPCVEGAVFDGASS